jgi:hypothetical protein
MVAERSAGETGFFLDVAAVLVGAAVAFWHPLSLDGPAAKATNQQPLILAEGRSNLQPKVALGGTPTALRGRERLV